ncbi:MAG: hypothetical protein AAF772_12165, partial [Acidobacteriota bacterium]
MRSALIGVLWLAAVAPVWAADDQQAAQDARAAAPTVPENQTAADDGVPQWTQWRGPLRTGHVIADADAWPRDLDGLAAQWRVPLGK